MRGWSTSKTLVRIFIAGIFLVGSFVLVSADKPAFTEHDKAFYASPDLVNFVRPGLVITIKSASIAADGTIKTRLTFTDPKGAPLEREGINTPGAITVSLIAAYIPKDKPHYWDYITRIQGPSPITGQSATQATGENNGTWVKMGEGDYEYTFRTKAPTTFEKNSTHTIGVYGRRDLTEFDMGTNYADATFNFVPDGSAVTKIRDVVATASCNKCHDQLAFHGGTRRSMAICVLCHTPQSIDPDSGNTVDMPVMTHKIHMGANLPIVQAGGKYVIYGNNMSLADYSGVVFPPSPQRCEACHEASNDAAKQKNQYLTEPSRASCGSCHDDVKFDTGEGHLGMPQFTDNMCSTCHIPQGEIDFDASIKGAHVIPEFSSLRTGVVVEILDIKDGVAGKKPTVTFTLKDGAGQPLPLSKMNRIGVVMAGPTTDYGATVFPGVVTPGYVSEDGLKSTCDSNGTCTYTMINAIPADAKGSYVIMLEARIIEELLAGTEKEVESEYGAINKWKYFSVDGSTVAARRTVTSTTKCNQCHSFLSLHGTNRNQVEACIICHNPKETDVRRRTTASLLPGESIDFRQMIHMIHTGEEIQRDYTIYGFGNTPHNYNEVVFPAFTLSGAVGDRRNCGMCHVNGSENLPLKDGLLTVKNPRGFIDPQGPETTACLGCHTSIDAASHALANTSSLGESCAVCHGSSAEYSVARAHAK